MNGFKQVPGEFCTAVLTLHHPIIIYSDHFKTHLNGKTFEQNVQYIIDECLLFVLINLLWKSWKKTKCLCCLPNKHVLEKLIHFIQNSPLRTQ